MTGQCRWLVLVATIGALLGTLRSQEILAVLSISVLAWCFSCWCLFRIRAGIVCRQLVLQRQVNSRPANQCTLWANRSASISVSLSVPKGTIPPFTLVREWLPELLEVLHGTTSIAIDTATSGVQLEYTCKVLAAGQVEFPGVQVQFLDTYGLFVVEHFVMQQSQVRSLPAFESVRDPRSSIKRINSLPQHGIHRLQRAGLGSELLELREYQPGDPPKSIAWKVSARRDRLMTRQYESEVPVRVNIIVDCSPETKLGPLGGRPIDQFNWIAASVARAALSTGDLVGLVLCDHHQIQRKRPSGGERAFYQILDALATATRPTTNVPRYSDSILRATFAMCSRRLPDLMDSKYNRVPFTVFPILPHRRRLWRSRVQLANAIAQVYGIGPNRAAEMYYDDASLCTGMQRLLSDNGWSIVLSNESRYDELNIDATTTTLNLSKAITESVAHARDNEVYVIFMNLNKGPEALEKIKAAARVAIARHHRVVFISNAVGEMRAKSRTAQTKTKGRRRTALASQEAAILERAKTIAGENHLKSIRREITQLGVKVAFAADHRAVALVLAEAELAGSGRSVTCQRTR
ncbi:MAG: DUF58 domain-containing protein [Planctomycetales bacterium]|nr:DUF58 domain-containing protein [Planctomycetales bacterium]